MRLRRSFFGEFEDLFNSADVHTKEQIKQDMSPDILLKAPATVTDDGAAQALEQAEEKGLKAGRKKIERQKSQIMRQKKKYYGRMWVTGKSDSYLLWCDRYE